MAIPFKSNELPLADPTAQLDEIHHVAITVNNVAESVEWYTKHFRCDVEYQDETWALLEFGNTRLALVISDQHPPHIGFIHHQRIEMARGVATLLTLLETRLKCLLR